MTEPVYKIDEFGIKCKRWYKNGPPYREGDPATEPVYEIDESGTKRWYLNGKFH